MTKKLNQLLRIDETNSIIEDPRKLGEKLKDVQNQENKCAEKDFEAVKRNLYELTIKGNKILDDLINMGITTEDPRILNVAGEIIDKLSSVNIKILHAVELNEKIKNIGKNKTTETTAGLTQNNITTNNSLYVGTTTDLFNALNNKDKK